MRKYRPTPFLAVLILCLTGTANAHLCRNPVYQMIEGSAVDDLRVVDADLEEVETQYQVSFMPLTPGAQAQVVPTGTFNAHDAFINVLAEKAGMLQVTTAWDYAPTFASGVCITILVISADETDAGHTNSAFSGDPVNTFTGELQMVEEPDLFLDGPFPLQFQRRYSSSLRRAFVVSRVGDNWRHNFNWSIHTTGNVLVVYDHRGHVRRYLKESTITNEWVQQTNLDKPLAVIQQILPDDNHFHILDPETEWTYQFSVPEGDNAFRLVEIRDNRGNAHQLSYNFQGDLASVTDGMGRTLQLFYDGGNNATRKLTLVSDGTRSVSFTYDGDLLTSFQNAAGNATTYNYDLAHNDSGLLTSKALPAGNTPWTQTWDDRGRVATQTDADGQTITFTYPTATAKHLGDPTTTTFPDGSSVVHEHDENGSLVEGTDERGAARTITGDSTGRRAAVSQPSGAMRLQTYDSQSGQPNMHVGPGGESYEQTYTSRTVAPGFELRELTGITYPDGGTITFTLDANGNRTARTTRAGTVWQTTFNSRGQPLTVTNPLGGTTTLTYNASGTRASETTPNGDTTTFQYDALFRLTTINRPDGSQRLYTYDALDRLTSLTTENGGTTQFTYDANSRLTQVTDPLGNTTVYQYDNNDRLVSETDRTGAMITYAYDVRGRPTSTALSDGRVFTYDHDASGRLSGIMLPSGAAVTRGFDADGFAVTRTAAGAESQLELDASGRVVARIDESGARHEFTYDDFGFQTGTTGPDGRSETYEYGTFDRIQRIQAGASGPATQFAYNDHGELSQITDPAGGVWTFGHDTSGHLTSSTDPLGRMLTISYDTRGRPQTTTYPGGLGTQTTSFNGQGLVTGRTWSDATAHTYQYDDLGRLTGTTGVSLGYDAESRVTESNGLTLTRRPHSGELASVTYATGKTVTYQYDSDGRLQSVTDWMGSAMDFEYDAAGQRTAINRANGVRTDLTLDGLGRIRDLQHGQLASVTVLRDPVGRVLGYEADQPTLPPVPQLMARTVDAAFQVDGFSYDALGRRTGDDRHTYLWGLDSRLRTITPQAGTAVDFTYDGNGLPIQRSEGSSTVDWVWNLGTELPTMVIERSGAQDLYYYVTDTAGRLLYRVDAVTNDRHYYHFDERGNTIALSDDAGAVIASYGYTPFGQMASTGGADNPYTFAGEYGMLREGDSGLFLGRVRVYDSHTGSFLSREAMGPHLHPLTFNPYGYAANDPLRFIDPTGTDPNEAAEAQQRSDGGPLNTAADFIGGITDTAGIAGHELGSRAEDLARAATSKLGASLSLGHEVGRYIEGRLGGDATSKKYLDIAEDYGQQAQRLDDAAERAARNANRLKAVGNVGRVFTALEVGQALWKLHGRLGKVMEGHSALEINLYQVFIEKSATAWDIYGRGKITEPTLRLRLNTYRRELQLALIHNDYLSLLDGTIHFWTAVGDIYGAFVPFYSLVGTEAIANAAHQHTPVGELWNLVAE